jgi:hypothetical protein
MGRLEENILQRIQQPKDIEDYINMLLAANIMGSEDLYQKAIDGLVRKSPKLTWEQAQEIGFEAYYTITSRSAGGKKYKSTE